MTGLGSLASTAKRRIGWIIRDRFPQRQVVRDVQGVRMVLPWSHRLPDYAAHNPRYSQNLVDLAKLLADSKQPLTVLDIGANVGDSTLQILNAADGRVLCVEADPAYLEFLHLNVDGDDRVAVVEALLAVEELGAATTAVRTGGTTRFAEGGSGGAMPSIAPEQLREEHADFADLRLVKSDTDGYDVVLVPAVAEAWASSRPVLFFEYDPYLTRVAGHDPVAVWPRLEALGYTHVAVWDNGGAAVGRWTPAEMVERTAVLDEQPSGRARARTYWDVAVVHADDHEGQGVLDVLVPAR